MRCDREQRETERKRLHTFLCIHELSIAFSITHHTVTVYITIITQRFVTVEKERRATEREREREEKGRENAPFQQRLSLSYV